MNNQYNYIKRHITVMVILLGSAQFAFAQDDNPPVMKHYQFPDKVEDFLEKGRVKIDGRVLFQSKIKGHASKSEFRCVKIDEIEAPYEGIEYAMKVHRASPAPRWYSFRYETTTGYDTNYQIPYMTCPEGHSVAHWNIQGADPSLVIEPIALEDSIQYNWEGLATEHSQTFYKDGYHPRNNYYQGNLTIVRAYHTQYFRVDKTPQGKSSRRSFNTYGPTPYQIGYEDERESNYPGYVHRIPHFVVDEVFVDQPEIYYKATSRFASGDIDATAQIKFLQLTEGGRKVKLQYQTKTNRPRADRFTEGYRSVPGWTTWTGFFELESCVAMDEERHPEDPRAQIKNLSQLLADEDIDTLPGQQKCTFKAPRMTSEDKGFSDDQVTIIIPDLKDVVLVVDWASASIHFDGIDYTTTDFFDGSVQQSVTRSSVRDMIYDFAQGRNQQLIESSTLAAEALLTIFKRSAKILSRVGHQPDTKLPNLATYLRANRVEIESHLKTINETLNNPEVPFTHIFNIVTSMERAFRVLNEEVGLRTNFTKTWSDFLVVQ